MLCVCISDPRTEQFGGQRLPYHQCICAKTTSRQIQEPLDDDADNLLAERIVRPTYRHSKVDLRNRLRGLQQSIHIRMHVDDLPPLIVDASYEDLCLFHRAIGQVDKEFNDLVKRVLVIVPEDDAVYVLHHWIGGGLQS